MAAETAKQVELLEATSITLMNVFMRDGFEPVAPAIIQPAGVFLDVIGESLRARTYVFTDPDGDELCLRPDLTVPACRLHLERDPEVRAPARYSYNGPAFRFQPFGADSSHPREFRQTGLESFGEADCEQAEAEVVGTIVRGLEAAGLATYTLRFGDLGLLRALLKAADMPARWRQRLIHLFWDPAAFKSELHRLMTDPGSRSATIPKALKDALNPDHPSEAEVVVAAYLEDQKLDLVGVRSPSEVAGMLLGRLADAASEPLSAKTAQLIASYVAIQSPARSAVKRLKDLATLMEIDLSDAIATYERRLNLLEQKGVDVERAEFAADFGRALEYYTGFVFEVLTPELGRKSPVAGGGRYDDLMKVAGAPRNVPAVGAAVHSERLVSALAGSSPRMAPLAAALGAPAIASGEEKTASEKLILAVPSKGRLMEQVAEFFAASDLVLRKTGNERGYRGELMGFADVEVAFISASEIAWYLKTGKAHIGITGEDLVREQMSDANERVMFLKKLGFGHADVVVAVPDCWLDVRTMDDLDDVALSFRRAHGRWYRVATKYLNITRRFFAAKGVTDYRIVESLGATEGTPAAGSAELIVDITSTGATLKANGLRILDDGIILRSEANLVASNIANWSPRALEARSHILRKLGLQP